jgi:hypothetical protein
MRQANHDRITTRAAAMLPAPCERIATSCPPAGSTSPGSSRRGILAGVATALATAAAVNATAIVKASGAEPDPIFGVIEAHRAAWRRASEAFDRMSGIEESLPRGAPHWAYFCDPVPADLDPTLVEACLDHRAAWEAHVDAAVELVTVLPTSIAGLIALLNYSLKFSIEDQCWPSDLVGAEGDNDENIYRPWHIWMQRHVVEVLEGMAAS